MRTIAAHLTTLHQNRPRGARADCLRAGRGALTLGTLHPLPTEPLHIPTLCMAGRLPEQNNAVVNLDLSAAPPAPGARPFFYFVCLFVCLFVSVFVCSGFYTPCLGCREGARPASPSHLIRLPALPAGRLGCPVAFFLTAAQKPPLRQPSSRPPASCPGSRVSPAERLLHELRNARTAEREPAS